MAELAESELAEAKRQDKLPGLKKMEPFGFGFNKFCTVNKR